MILFNELVFICVPKSSVRIVPVLMKSFTDYTILVSTSILS